MFEVREGDSLTLRIRIEGVDVNNERVGIDLSASEPLDGEAVVPTSAFINEGELETIIVITALEDMKVEEVLEFELTASALNYDSATTVIRIIDATRGRLVFEAVTP